jgi:hypothetical protein
MNTDIEATILSAKEAYNENTRTGGITSRILTDVRGS